MKIKISIKVSVISAMLTFAASSFAQTGYWTETVNTLSTGEVCTSNTPRTNGGSSGIVNFSVHDVFQHLVSGSTTTEPGWETLFQTLVSAVVTKDVTGYCYMAHGDTILYCSAAPYDIGTNSFDHYTGVGGSVDTSASRDRWWDYDESAYIKFSEASGGAGGGE
jgi:hypothetical protein